jgi:cyclic pyranopterin phosphate synthase
MKTIEDTLSRPLVDLRISVTDRCNFRCPYCMPAEIFGERYKFLPKTDILTFEEIERLARIFVDFGARKLRLTGGEPLVRVDFPRLVERLARIERIEDLALTTNGFLLPKYAQALKDAGLRRVTVSLDSLDDTVFRQMSGLGYSKERVLQGIEAAEKAGLCPIKINCVVQKGVNDHTLVDLARHFKGTGHIVRFIEFMDVGNLNGWDITHVLTAKEIIDGINAELPIEAAAANYPGEVATRFLYKDGSGEIGVIASVSQPFCGDCSRARLSTDGKLVTCLFAKDGYDLRGPMRAGASDRDLHALIQSVWSRRSDRYSESRFEILQATGKSPRYRKIEMHRLGG